MSTLTGLHSVIGSELDFKLKRSHWASDGHASLAKWTCSYDAPGWASHKQKKHAQCMLVKQGQPIGAMQGLPATPMMHDMLNLLILYFLYVLVQLWLGQVTASQRSCRCTHLDRKMFETQKYRSWCGPTGTTGCVNSSRLNSIALTLTNTYKKIVVQSQFTINILKYQNFRKEVLNSCTD